MRRSRKSFRDDSGAAAVEFAIVGPVAIMMIFGVIEAGRLMFVFNSMQAALSTAARESMLDPDATTTQIRTAFCNRAFLIDCAETDIAVASQTVSGQTWRVVTATTPFESPLSGLLPLPTQLTQSERTPIFVES